MCICVNSAGGMNESKKQATTDLAPVIFFDREVDGADEDVLEAVESLKTKGFINFYGTQPFGNNCVLMRGIGCELLKGNWQQVRMCQEWGAHATASGKGFLGIAWSGVIWSTVLSLGKRKEWVLVRVGSVLL